MMKASVSGKSDQWHKKPPLRGYCSKTDVSLKQTGYIEHGNEVKTKKDRKQQILQRSYGPC